MKPHDLLVVRDAAAEQATPFSSALPAWTNPHWPVVMRRAPCSPDGVWVPVGMRGVTRSERFPVMVKKSAISHCIAPESLVTDQAWLMHAALADFPCVVALNKIANSLKNFDLPWGPAGSVGFALATGVAILRVDSDLDLLIRATHPLSAIQIDVLRSIQLNTKSNACNIDIQIDTGRGGFAFAEWLRGPTKILLKTNAGPLLTVDPWCMPERGEQQA